MGDCYSVVLRMKVAKGSKPNLAALLRTWMRRVGDVRDLERLRDYVRGPNWDDPDCGYAHYRETVAAYGAELLGLFERMRGDGKTEEYGRLLAEAGIEEVR